MIYIPIAVALVCFIIYALDRKMKNEPISWESAGKLSLFGGLLASSIVFATGPEIQQVVETVAEVAPKALESDMFVGVPTF
jgi:hypothetical protein